jgi:hypothetical protein
MSLPDELYSAIATDLLLAAEQSKQPTRDALAFGAKK